MPKIRSSVPRMLQVANPYQRNLVSSVPATGVSQSVAASRSSTQCTPTPVWRREPSFTEWEGMTEAAIASSTENLDEARRILSPGHGKMLIHDYRN
jgi:hypothetical protein